MLRWIGAAVSIGLVGRVLAYLIGASHLGFNVTDEGYYLLAARFPEDVTAWPNAAHVYLAPLFRLVGMDVVTFRLVGLAMAVGGALVLATGLGRLLVGLGMSAARDVAGWLAAAAMITSGVLLHSCRFLHYYQR
jgi:hypothetical protein